jgi:Holliday junction resolvase RusA-like endonuclease
MIAKFEVIGKVQGKARARSYRMGNFIRHVTPEKTVNYENLIKLSYLETEQPKFMNDEPLMMRVVAFIDIPKSFSKRKREQALSGFIYPTKKPDADNIAKVVCDALNKVAYNDDTQIVNLTIAKRYAECEKLEVTIQPLTNF